MRLGAAFVERRTVLCSSPFGGDGRLLALPVPHRARIPGQAARLLIEHLTPQRPLSRGSVLQAHRNAVARDALAAEFGLLSSSDVAELSMSAARNAGATAARWRAAGRIFAVTSGGKAALFPGFQFDAGGQPVPVIADILATLADRVDPWSLALWFTGDNPRLGGLRPVDTLNGDPDAVLAAARALADDLTRKFR